MRRLSSNGCRVTVAVFLFAASLTCATALGQEGTFGLQSQILIDREAGRVYAMSPGGGFDALDLASGAVLWHSDLADKPLAVSGEMLVSQVESLQAGRLEVAILDAASGRLLRTSAAELPADTIALVDNRMGYSFHAWALPEDKDLVLGWGSSRQKIGGAGSGPVETAASGLSLKVETGELVPLQSAPPVPKARGELTASEKLAGISGRQFLSSDGLTLLTSEPIEDRWAYRWRMYTLDGAPLGEIESPYSYVPFFVEGSLVLFLSKPEMRMVNGRQIGHMELRALDLQSGIEVWKHPVRDTRYYGPYPP